MTSTLRRRLLASHLAVALVGVAVLVGIGLVVGDTAWAFLPGEIFSEFGLDIKARSPWPRTHVITLSNGDLPGYCVTREALVEGGYEPGNSILDPASGDVLTDAAVDLLTTIRNAQERP